MAGALKLCLLTGCPFLVQLHDFKGIFPCDKKTEGMNLILQAANGSVPCSLEDLLTFITGADRIPPNGFSRMIKVQFFDVEALEKRRPFASTCSLQLYLPRGISETEQFNNLMISAIKDSMGFGKV